ncbi:MAG: LysR family transcriptional regulator [Deltaproteobacteria bacterium]|nr:LysR family transcriptional regulator [Deltaproteobacteria bacterium]MBW2396134.1 LysR family transcriptional regulator [Deltaproteobacteria bacterium]
MDKLAAMRTFVEIVDQGSLTAAARALDRAPPTVVRTLATLEETLGARLLTRTTRRMSLTEEGRAYLDRCRRILADVEEAEQAVQAGDSEPRGEIRVTAPVLFGQRHVAPAITAFLQQFAKVRIELLLLDRVVHLVEEGLDLGVRIGHLEDSSMIVVPVGEMRRVVVASPDLVTRVGDPAHPEQLAPHPCVMFRGIAAGGSFSFQDGGRRRTVRVTSAFACNQATAAVEACEAGLGFGQFLSYQVEPQIRAGTLRVVLQEFEIPALPVSLVYPEARLMSSRLRAFVDWMKEQLRARPEIH